MFVVYTQPAPGLHPYDSKEFPKLGYIADKPDLVWTELKSVHQTVQKNHTGKLEPNGTITVTGTTEEPALDLGLTTEETAAFFKLTTTYKGHKTLVFLNDTPLSAPMVDGPIDTPLIRLSGKLPQPDKLAQELQTLVPKAKP